MYPRRRPERADDIDGVLGDGSQFQSTYGYYAHGVGPETVRAPAGWEDRLIKVEVPPRPGSSQAAVALCLEPHDLVLSKCAAGRDRDWDFARDALKGGLVEFEELTRRTGDLPLDHKTQDHVATMLDGIAKKLGLLRS